MLTLVGFIERGREKGSFLLALTKKKQNQTVHLSANENRKVASQQLPMFDNFSVKRSQ